MFIFVQNTNYSFSDNGGNSVDYLRPRVFGLQLSSSVREKKKKFRKKFIVCRAEYFSFLFLGYFHCSSVCHAFCLVY